MRKLLVLCCLMLLPLAGGAKEAEPLADDPVLEKRLTVLAEELRCLVCQNQSIADSHAELAVDLRNQIREQMKAGKSDAEIKSYMVSRYGDFIMYRPPVKSTTALLWFGPLLLVVAGLAILIVILRKRARYAPDVHLTREEQERAERLLTASAKSNQQ